MMRESMWIEGRQFRPVGRQELGGVKMKDVGTSTEIPTSSLVGVAGFEPTASSSRTKRATKLRHTPYNSFMIANERG